MASHEDIERRHAKTEASETNERERHPDDPAPDPRLFEDLALARLNGRYPRLTDKLTRVQLLILDDFGTHNLTDQ